MRAKSAAGHAPSREPQDTPLPAPPLCSLPRAPPIGRALQGVAWGLPGPSPSFTKPSGEGGLELAAHGFLTNRVLSFGDSVSTHTLLLPFELPSKTGSFVSLPNRLLIVNTLPVNKDFLSLSPKVRSYKNPPVTASTREVVTLHSGLRQSFSNAVTV